MLVLMFIIIKWLRKDVKNKQSIGNETASHLGKKKFITVANKNPGTMAAGTHGVPVQQELGKGSQSMAKNLTRSWKLTAERDNCSCR